MTGQDQKIARKRSIGIKVLLCWPVLIGLYTPYRLGYGDALYHVYNAARLVIFIGFISRAVIWYHRQAKRSTDALNRGRMNLMKFACLSCAIYPLTALPDPEQYVVRPDLTIAVITGSLFYLGYIPPEWFKDWLSPGRHRLDEEDLHSLMALAGLVSDFYSQMPMNRYFLEYCIKRFAGHIAMPGERVDLIVKASYLLEIGRVPQPSIPSDGEQSQTAIWKQSADYVGETLGFRQIAQVIRHTSERWDGNGYPDGLVSEQIPYESRVLALMNAFGGELYMCKDGNAALKEVNSREGAFDPQLLAALEEMTQSESSSVS